MSDARGLQGGAPGSIDAVDTLQKFYAAAFAHTEANITALGHTLQLLQTSANILHKAYAEAGQTEELSSDQVKAAFATEASTLSPTTLPAVPPTNPTA